MTDVIGYDLVVMEIYNNLADGNAYIHPLILAYLYRLDLFVSVQTQ